MKKTFLLAFALVISALATQGQEIRPNFPNGFHLGVNMQGNLSQRADIIPFGNINESSLKSNPRMGYNFGIEASYHFAKYYGVSVGVDVESNSAMNIQRKTNDGYVNILDFGNRSMTIPVRFEFHYPIMRSNFLFYGALGISLENLKNRSSYRGSTFNDEENGLYLTYIDRNARKPKVCMQARLGVYYRLPYNDLLRLSITSNYTFQDRFQGDYSYNGENGALTYRHNYLGLELSYIHCFRTKEQKAAIGR